VISFDETGSVVADLDEIAEAISDRALSSWIASTDYSTRTKLAFAKYACDEYVLNTITGANGVVDITADVLADLHEEAAR